jgi:hypothetical protein
MKATIELPDDLSVDFDFTVYRKHDRTPLTLIHPAAS